MAEFESSYSDWVCNRAQALERVCDLWDTLSGMDQRKPGNTYIMLKGLEGNRYEVQAVFDRLPMLAAILDVKMSLTQDLDRAGTPEVAADIINQHEGMPY